MTTNERGRSRVVWIKRSIFGAVVLVVAAGMLMATAGFRKPFTVAAFLRIREPAQPIIRGDAPVKFDREEMADFKATQVALIRSPVVLNLVLKQPDIAELPIIRDQRQPASWLLEELHVDFLGSTSLMKISMKGSEQSQLVEILDAVCATYLEEFMSKDRNSRLQKLNTLEMMHAQYEMKIRRKRAELKSLSGALGIEDSDVQRKIGMLRLEATLRREEQLQERLAELELEVALAQKRQAQTTEDDADVAEDATVKVNLIETERKVLSEQLDVLQEKRKQLVDSMPNSAPQIDVELMRDEIEVVTEVAASLKREIALTSLELSPTSRVQLLGSRVQLLSKAAVVEQ